jgi:hypothetical protein
MIARVDLSSDEDMPPEADEVAKTSAVADTAVPAPVRGPFCDFAVHGISGTGLIPTVLGNACIVVLADVMPNTEVVVAAHPGTVAFTVALRDQRKFPWKQCPVVLLGQSVLSATLESMQAWGELGGEFLMDTAVACPAAYVIELKLRHDHFITGIPLVFRIGIIVAAGRLDDAAWSDAKSAMGECMVTLVTIRGGGDTTGKDYGKLPPGYMFPNVGCNDVDSIMYHVPRTTKLWFVGKMQHQRSPVVWLKCKHAPISIYRTRGGCKGLGSGKDMYTGKGSSNRGGGKGKGSAKGVYKGMYTGKGTSSSTSSNR